MKSNRVTAYLALTWLLTVGIAYVIGWWVGVKSVTRVAADATHSGMWLVLGVLAIVAVLTAITGFRMRGYLDRNHHANPV